LAVVDGSFNDRALTVVLLKARTKLLGTLIDLLGAWLGLQ
jgi:hypothetical protein